MSADHEHRLQYAAEATIPYRPGLHPCCERDTDRDGNCDRHPPGAHVPLRCNPSVRGTGSDVQCSCGELVYGFTLDEAEEAWRQHRQAELSDGPTRREPTLQPYEPPTLHPREAQPTLQERLAAKAPTDDELVVQIVKLTRQRDRLAAALRDVLADDCFTDELMNERIGAAEALLRKLDQNA